MIACLRSRAKLRELFPADLRGQKQKLMQMIATAVGGLNNLNQLVPAVKALGARHSSYGVTTEHYRLVEEALLWTLERGLGQDFTPEGSLRLGQGLPRVSRHHASGRGASR